MQSKPKGGNLFSGAGAELGKKRAAIAQLAKSGEARQLMDLLQQRGSVQEAARAAADGDPSRLMEMMNQLMNTKEGAELVERIGAQAKQAGLK